MCIRDRSSYLFEEPENLLKQELREPAIYNSITVSYTHLFQGPLIYIDSVTKYPTSLGLRLLTDAESGFEWNKVLALSVVTLIPSLVVFFAAQDPFVAGIAAGGVKG